MKNFILGSLCGVLVGLIGATAWTVRAGDALDEYLQQQRARQEQDRYLDLREAEFETRMRAQDPCRK